MKKRRIEKDVIYQERINGTYLPIGHTIKIVDGDEPVITSKTEWLIGDKQSETVSFKFSKQGVQKVKELIANAKYLFDKQPLKHVDNTETYAITDGTDQEYFFRFGEKEAIFSEYELRSEYAEEPRDTKAGELLYIIDSIGKIIKDHGINPYL